ncbi:MAG: anhydro-N-acetylmuramic acid kinase [Aquabacterium sp.]
MPATELFVGLMSGTSMDGVDAVLVQLPGDAGAPMALHAHVHEPFPASLRTELLALNSHADNELHRAARAGILVAQAYARATDAVCAAAAVRSSAVRALGAHGQTVRHRPDDDLPYTIQLLDAAVLAELSGIDVVSDFRPRDVAAGGQGAPLVPAFHAALFARPGLAQGILNIGGIANLTLLDGADGVSGFDCGPGCMLLDLWCQRHRGEPFDRDGAWASTGQVDASLLAAFESEPFLHRVPPKSTGRDLFHAGWLERHLASWPDCRPVDVQATLAALTANVAAVGLRLHLPKASRLLVCGGGAFNLDLIRRLRSAWPEGSVGSTADEGLPPQQVEAAAFAWLAQSCVLRRPGNEPAVTGARGSRILGRITPA